MEKQSISLKGDKEKWKRFVNVLRLENKDVWDFFEPIIDKVIANQKTSQKA